MDVVSWVVVVDSEVVDTTVVGQIFKGTLNLIELNTQGFRNECYFQHKKNTYFAREGTSIFDAIIAA